MSTDGAIRTVSRNLFFNLAGAVWQLVIVLVGTRLVLQAMGTDSFGLLALIGGVSGYFMYMEIGMGETVVKKVSESESLARISVIASTLFYYSIGFGLFLTVITGLFARYGVPLMFDFTPELMQSAGRMFMVIAAAVWVLYPLNLFNKILVGLQRLDLYNILRVIFMTLMLAAILLALKFNPTAEAAALAITLTGLVWKAAAWFMMKRVYPSIQIAWRLTDGPTLKDLLRYKGWVFVSQAAGHTINQCDIYIIGILLNPAAIAIYSIANVVAIKVFEAAGVIGTAVFPALSRLHGNSRMDQQRKAFVLGPQLIVLLLLPAAAFFSVYAQTIIRLWVGEEYMTAAPALIWLSAAWLIFAVSLAPAMTAKAVDRPEIDTRWAVLMAVANIVLDVTLIHKLGMMGAVYATFVTYLVGTVANLFVVGHVIQGDAMRTVWALFKITAAGLLFVPVYYVPMPVYLFWLRPIAHTLLLWGSWYYLLSDEENRGYVANMARLVTGRFFPRW